MATEVTGAQTLAAAVKDATARNGWRQSDLQEESRLAMADADEDRVRLGLSERTWQDIWRGKKTIEMDSYSYATVDRTLSWIPGSAWALHHDQEPPADQDKVDLMLAEIEGIRGELHEMRGLVDELREQEPTAKLVDTHGAPSDGEGVWIPLPLLRRLLAPET